MNPLFIPTVDQIQKTQIYQFINYVNQKHGYQISNYRQLYSWSIDKLEEFWQSFIEFTPFVFQKKPENTILWGKDFIETKFFPDAEMNFAQNLLRFSEDPHLKNKIAIASYLENEKIREITFEELKILTQRLVSFLKNQGFGPTNRAAIILPNSWQAILALLAVTALGGVFSSASADFGYEALWDRFSQVEPQVLFLCDGYIYKGERFYQWEKFSNLLKNLPSVKTVIYCPLWLENFDKKDYFQNSTSAQIFSLPEILNPEGEPNLSYEPRTFQEPLYIMFSSGTTGKPKAIVQGLGVFINQTKEHILHNDLRNSDCLMYYTTTGWMMWNWQAAALFTGAKLVLYDGNPLYPHEGILWEIAQREGVTVFGTSARYLQLLQQKNFKNPPKNSIRLLLSTGSPLLEENFYYVAQNLLPNTPIFSISGGTDLNGCFVLGNPLEPVYPEIQGPALAMAVEVYDENGQKTLAEGELVVEKPFPAKPLYFLGDSEHKKYRESYFARFSNVWCHGDFICKTPRGGYVILGRSDATLNPGGVRIGTAEIYRALEGLSFVLDSLAIGLPTEKGEVIVLFVVLQSPIDEEEAKKQIKNAIRQKMSARHVPQAIFFVNELPYTMNGKKSELAVKNIFTGKKVTNRAALANPNALNIFEQKKDEFLFEIKKSLR